MTTTASEQLIGFLRDALYADDAERRVRREGFTKQNAYITDYGQCGRRVVYSLWGAEEDAPDADGLANFRLGHAAENTLAKVLEGYGAKMLREVKVTLRLPDDYAEPELIPFVTTGRCDFMFTIPGAQFIAELKTTTHKSITGAMRRGNLGKLEHRKQLLGYLHAGKNGAFAEQGWGPELFDMGVLLYWVKDAGNGRSAYYAFDVRYDEQAALYDIARNAALMQYAATHDPADPPNRPSGYEAEKAPCKFCPFRTTCWTT